MKTPHQSLKKTLLHSFLGGIAWAVGATVGLTILIAIIGSIINFLGGLPFIGEIVGKVVEHTLDYLNNPPQITP